MGFALVEPVVAALNVAEVALRDAGQPGKFALLYALVRPNEPDRQSVEGHVC